MLCTEWILVSTGEGSNPIPGGNLESGTDVERLNPDTLKFGTLELRGAPPI
jgi:hypothetical protein